MARRVPFRASSAPAPPQRCPALARGIVMRRAGRFIVRVLAAIGFLYVLVSVTPIDRWCIRFLAGPGNDPKGEVLIVLGADSVNDVIGAASYWRSVYAVRVWRAGGFKEVLVCAR